MDANHQSHHGGDLDSTTSALEQAEESYRKGGLPIGAVMVQAGGVVAPGHNGASRKATRSRTGRWTACAGGRRRRYAASHVHDLEPLHDVLGHHLPVRHPGSSSARTSISRATRLPAPHGVAVRCSRMSCPAHGAPHPRKAGSWHEDIAGGEAV